MVCLLPYCTPWLYAHCDLAYEGVNIGYWVGLVTVQSAGSNVRSLKAVISIANTIQCTALHNATI